MGYRLGDLERRFVEFRQVGAAIEGTAIRYGDVAQIGDFGERFEPGSLTYADVVVNIQHDRSKPVARIGAGLELRDSSAALLASIDPPDTVYGRELRELLSARILRGLSLEFRTAKERWEGAVRVVQGAELVGIGVVDRPAYPDSQIAARMLAAAAIPPRSRRRRAQ